MIEREEIKFLAAADFTDDCRVSVQLRKRRTTMTVPEARAFRRELDAAIGEASRAADDLLHRDVPPAGFDMLLGPDCRDEKHRACDGRSWDVAADCETRCECPCYSRQGDRREDARSGGQAYSDDKGTEGGPGTARLQCGLEERVEPTDRGPVLDGSDDEGGSGSECDDSASDVEGDDESEHARTLLLRHVTNFKAVTA